MSAIRVELQLADGSFTTGMLRAGQTVEQFNKQLMRTHPHLEKMAANGDAIYKSMKRAEEGTGTFLGTLRDAAIVVGAVSMGVNAFGRTIGNVIGKVVSVNAEMERLQLLMANMSTAKDPMADATESIDALINMAKQAPFSLQTLTNAFVKLKATGTDPLAGSMNSLADGIAAAGGNSDAFNRIVLGISQMRGKGVIQMEELRQQLSESMPRAMELMARSMGVSMADFVDAVATGRVEAEHALNSLYDELELTFGGSALRMMDTWDGKLAQLSTNMLTLSRAAGEGFFKEIKDELQSLNDTLSTPAATDLARSIGQMMGTSIEVVRGVIDGIVKMQEPIKLVGLMMLSSFGGKAVLAGVGQLARSLASLSTGFVTLSASMAANKAAKEAAAIAAKRHADAVNIGTAAVVAQNVQLQRNSALMNGTALSTAAARIGGVASGLATFAGVASGVLGWIGLIGGGIVLLADHFGWFTDKADQAAAALDGFNSANAEEFRVLSDEYQTHIDKLATQITAQREMIDNAYDSLDARRDKPALGQWFDDTFDSINGMLWDKTVVQQIENAETALASNEKTLAQMMARREAAEKRHNDALMRERLSAYEDTISEELRLDRSKNDEARKNISAAYQENLQAAEGNEKEIVRLRTKYAEDMHQNQVDFLARQIEVYDKHYETVKKLAEQSGEQEGGIFASIAESLLNQLSDFQERRARLMESGPNSIKMIDSPNVSDKAFEDAGKVLDKLQDSMSSMGADGDDAVGVILRLNKAIEEQDFGSIKDGAVEFKKLRDQIAKTWAEQKKLDEVMEGRKSFNERLKALLDENALNLWKAQREAAGLPTDEIAELDWRLDKGEFAGLAPVLDRQTREAILRLNELETQANDVAAAAQKQAFGDTTQQTIQTTATNVRNLKEEVLSLVGVLNGVSFDNMRFMAGGGIGSGADMLAGMNLGPLSPTVSSGDKRARMAQAMQYFTSQGWTPEQAAGIVGNLSGESSFNPNARNKGDGRDGSDSIGIAQWNSDRAIGLQNFAARKGTPWNDFQTQLEYIQHELMTNEAAAGSRLRLAGTPEQASNTFMRAYERPSDKSIITSGPKRAAAALEAVGMVNGSSISVMLDPASVSAIGETFIAPVSSIAKAVQPVRTYDEAKDGLADARTGANTVETLTKQNALSTAVTQLERAIANAEKGIAHDGLTVEKVQSQIQEKKFGSNDDVDAAEYQRLIQLAKDYEAAVKRIDDAEDARNEGRKSLDDLAKQEVDLVNKAADLHEQMRTGIEGTSGKLRDFISEIDAHVEAVRTGYGADSAEYAAAMTHRQQLLSNFHMAENMQAQMASQERTQSIRQGLMSESQARQYAMQQRIAELDAMIAAVDQSEAQGVELVRQYEAEKAAIRQQYAAQSNPMAAQMREWGDLQGNLAKQSTQWMNSLADGLTNLVMGTGDLKSVLQGILKDMLNSAIKFMMSGMMGGKGGGGAKGGAKGMTGGGAKGGGIGKLFGMAHTGGVIGQSRLASKMMSPSIFAGAKKYHTGGIIDPKLLPNEVPIIAKKGEGVFTPEQMKALAPAGGSSSNFNNNVTISSNVTVNASGGSAEQNEDLARQTARAVDAQVRAAVHEELQKSRRPGGYMQRR